MKAYFLTNMYISPIQHGIQTAHCIAEMFLNYPYSENLDATTSILYEWAEKHKTILILNGGTSGSMKEAVDIIAGDTPWDAVYPWGIFFEPDLDNALTCVGIVLPEDFDYSIPFETRVEDMTYDQRIASLLASKHLAR